MRRLADSYVKKRARKWMIECGYPVFSTQNHGIIKDAFQAGFRQGEIRGKK